MDDAEAAAMAEAMGFSSFGAQKPSKRRKFNPGADAVVASTSTATSAASTSSNHVGGPLSSGSNSTPLGVRTQNNDEISLHLDDDDHDGDPAAGTGAAPHTAAEDDREPQYIDISRPPAPANAGPGDDVQTRIDSIVGVPYGQHFEMHTVPVYNQASRGGRGGRGGHQSARDRDGDKGKWWEDYYDPSSNVNPWERLEHDRGLKPRGLWMSWEEAQR
ncbi:hypothetical protein DL766_003964 [Monosporascus sp. MC13-8B]|uniref:Uncharacterized protein n=1 Tax=Monosporascus cannonballus TaxID=155416 RepID=A0ABY0HAF5_9PEZI|nr:hypothetical protein DL762_004983 [Monosporascus cannonballus]RYO96459.1 hypothetical protein DL763_003208 [Monosporascus cannonballus]RYP32476.1 hypothetical protein DL766_003964 [Monosporascus sp. MC13-8B]